MSKNKLLIIILMLTVMLTGCFPSGEMSTPDKPAVNSTNNTMSENSENSDASEPTEPKPTVPNDLEHVKFDIELDDEYPTEVPVIKAKRRSFDFEEVKQIFFAEKDLIGGENGIYYTDDGITFVCRDDQINYQAEHRYDEEKQLIYDIQKTAAKNVKADRERYHKLNSELEGFPRSEALERANELVGKLGLKYLSEPMIYTFTSEEVDVNVVKYMLTKEGERIPNIHLPKEDEFYLVKYLTAYNGIPVPDGSLWDLEDHVAPSLEIILTKDELVDLSSFRMYDNIEVVDATQMNCSAETALSKLYDYYAIKDENGQLENRFEFNYFSLAYITYNVDWETGEVTYKPMWHVGGTMYDTDGTALSNKPDKFIDPTTGYIF